MNIVPATPIEDMTRYALEGLLSGGDGHRRELVRRMCQRWPEEPALSVSFALTSAAALIEDNFGRHGDSEGLAPLAWRMAALLAADTYAAECLGHSPAKARDLLHFWRRVDPAFLDA